MQTPATTDKRPTRKPDERRYRWRAAVVLLLAGTVIAYSLKGTTTSIRSCDRFATSYTQHVLDLFEKPQVQAVLLGDSRMGRLRNFQLGQGAYNLAFHGDGPRETLEKLRYVLAHRPPRLDTAFVLMAPTPVDPPSGRRRSAWMAKQLEAMAHPAAARSSSTFRRAYHAIGACLTGLRGGPVEDGSNDDAKVWQEIDDLAERHRVRLIGVRLPERSRSAQRSEPGTAGAFDAVIDLSTLRLPADRFDSVVHLGPTGAESVLAALADRTGIAGMRPAQEAPLSEPADGTATKR